MKYYIVLIALIFASFLICFRGNLFGGESDALTPPLIRCPVQASISSEQEGKRRERVVKGIVPTLLTPLSDVDTLDVAGWEKLVARLLDGGVHELFVPGTCGEWPSSSDRLREEVVKKASNRPAENSEQVFSRRPIFSTKHDHLIEFIP